MVLNPSDEKERLVLALKGFASGARSFDEVDRVANEIFDRWSAASLDDLPPESSSELPLWCAIWDIVSSCRDSLLDPTGSQHPVLQHVAYLEGTNPIPDDWSASRP